MDLLSKTKDIIDIRLGHESDGATISYIGKHHDEIEKERPVISVYDAYGQGFETGIKFLANYLKEFGIDVVMHEEVIKTTSKEDWYSGTIVEH